MGKILERFYARHEMERSKLPPGWGEAFIAPVIPPAITQTQKRAREILAANGVDVEVAVTISIYQALAAVEEALICTGKGER